VEDVPLPQPDYLLVDGKFSVPLNLPQDTFIKGESRSSSIAAASIAAKITRDEIMAQLHEQYPDYNFLKNKGYPTKEHREALARLGPSACHRKTFKGVREHVKQSTTPRQKR
jgi:ribonuclease HII